MLGIAELVYKVIKTWKAHASNKKRGLRVHVSTAFFVPKPFTPFQWERQDTMEEYRRKTQLLKNAMPSKSVEYNWHDAKLSQLEAVLARGDRRLCRVLEAAVALGVKLDGWDEYFDYDAWMAAFAACGIDPAFDTTRGYRGGRSPPLGHHRRRRQQSVPGKGTGPGLCGPGHARTAAPSAAAAAQIRS